MKNMPNAVCSFCEGHYVARDFWCDSFGVVILDPLKPRRCSRYEGEPITLETLKYLRDHENKQLRLDNVF